MSPPSPLCQGWKGLGWLSGFGEQHLSWTGQHVRCCSAWGTRGPLSSSLWASRHCAGLHTTQLLVCYPPPLPACPFISSPVPGAWRSSLLSPGRAEGTAGQQAAGGGTPQTQNKEVDCQVKRPPLSEKPAVPTAAGMCLQGHDFRLLAAEVPFVPSLK